MNFDGLFSTAANIQRVFASLELVLRGRIESRSFESMQKRDGDKRIKEAAQEGGGGATLYKTNNNLFVFVRGSIGFSGFLMFFIDFIHIASGNDACGQSHNGNAEDGRKHRDHTSERRDRIDVTVSDRG